jgi:hypothetical protein
MMVSLILNNHIKFLLVTSKVIMLWLTSTLAILLNGQVSLPYKAMAQWPSPPSYSYQKILASRIFASVINIVTAAKRYNL